MVIRSIARIRGRTVLIAGFTPRSGAGAARLLARLKCRIRVWDEKNADALAQAFRKSKGIRFAARFLGPDSGRHEAALKGADLVVLSPGVPLAHPLLKLALTKGVPVISEVELAWLYCPVKWICVTGTDGKTTTTTLAGLVFKAAGKKTIVAGNIGLSLCEAVLKAGRKPEFVIAELSSFQLETSVTLRPSVAIVLNVTPDHLDRYPDLSAYAAAKARIWMNQTAADALVVKEDDANIRRLLKKYPPKSRLVRFARSKIPGEAAYVDEGRMMVRLNGRSRDYLGAAELRIKGEHNKENVLAVLAAAELAGLPIGRVIPALRKFRGVEHRCEPAGTVEGRSFINDSKATTLNAVRMALLSMSGKVILLMGGRDKGDDFRRIAADVRSRVKRLVLFGEAGPLIDRRIAFKPKIRIGTMVGAVREAYRTSRPGDIILLSPGCTSYDEFNNFEERGRVFKKLVRSLPSEIRVRGRGKASSTTATRRSASCGFPRVEPPILRRKR